MAKVTDISGLILKTPNLEDSVEFYEKCWGLRRMDYPGADTVFFKGVNDESAIFGLEVGERRSVSMIRLALDSVSSVDSMYDALKAAKIEILNAPDCLRLPGNHYGFQFKDPDGNPIELSTSDDPVSATAPDEGFLPRRLSHLVLNSPNNRTLRDFYIRYLGFELADWYEKDVFFFLRCNEQHHCVGLEQGDNSSLNHVAFLLDDLDAMMRFVGRMANLGIAPLWGPGRHGPGGNCFCYFEDPAGYVLEVTAELISIPSGEQWVPKEWRLNPANANVWLTGGRPTRAIQLMSNH